MKLIPTLKREKKAVGQLAATGGVLSALRQGWSPFPVLGGGSAQRIVDTFATAQSANYAWMYQKSPAVRTVVDVIVRNLGQLELRLYEELSESERQPRPDHPAALSLRYPDEETAGDKFVRAIVKDYLVHDNAYALLTAGPEGKVRLQRIPAYMVQVQGDSLFRVDNYRVWQQGAWTEGGNWSGAGTAIDVAPAAMLHWHGEHPLDPRIGLSRLDTLRDVIAEDAALAQAIIELANNGLQAPIWVSRPLEAPEMNPPTLKAHEEDLANRLRHRNRRPPVMIEGEQLQSFGTSPQDAQMLEVRRWALQRVAGVFGVPGGMVGLTSATPDDTAQFYQDTLPPYCQDLTRFLNQRLLIQVFDWPEGTFEFDLDEKTGWSQLPNLVSATGRPIMTTNEGRAKLNLAPKPGGDDLVTPLNTTTGDNPLPAPGVMPVQDPNKPPQDGSYRSDQGPTPLPSGNASADGVEVKKAIIPSRPPYRSRREVDKEKQDRNVARFEKALGGWFRKVEPELKATVPQRKANGRKATADWKRWTGDLANLLFAIIRDVVGGEGARYASKFGGTFDMSKTLNYRRAMADGSAEQILDTVRQEVDQMGLDAALARTSQHAASAGGSLGVRSTTWARREAARQSPQPDHVFQETWVKDTERHAALDGKSVPLGEAWEGGIKPGTAPGCRCTSSIS